MPFYCTYWSCFMFSYERLQYSTQSHQTLTPPLEQKWPCINTSKRRDVLGNTPLSSRDCPRVKMAAEGWVAQGGYFPIYPKGKGSRPVWSEYSQTCMVRVPGCKLRSWGMHIGSMHIGFRGQFLMGCNWFHPREGRPVHPQLRQRCTIKYCSI